MVGVSVEDVRDAANIVSADVSDARLLKMIKRSEVALKLELGKEIDYANCSEAEKEAITVLASIHALCYLSGGSCAGLSFHLGDLNSDALSKAPSLDVLQAQLERMLSSLRQPQVRSV
jgi:hypothetical protein